MLIVFSRILYYNHDLLQDGKEKIMYLDPGFGSMVLQLVLAGILGAGVLIRVFWKKIKGIFQKKQDVVSEISDDIDYGDED